jgi:2-oxoisovalerate dehydrogenase E1 component alpha subunit
MVMARAIGRHLWLLKRLSGVVASFGVEGFEAVQVAAAAALRHGVDWVVPHHRDLALCLAVGMSPLDVMLAVHGRAADPGSGGRQLPGTFGLRRARIVSTSGLAGDHVLHAAGIAYASKLRVADEVTLVTVGARGTGSGDWHEGLNFAAVHSLPLVCLVQDGGPRAAAPPGRHDADLIVSLADGYGINGETVDGGDFEGSFITLFRAVERAREGRGPSLVHARVAPVTALSPGGARLAREQLEAAAHDDPVEQMRRRLREEQLLDEATDDQVQRDCAGVVGDAADQALRSPAPETAAALDNVFARM